MRYAFRILVLTVMVCVVSTTVYGHNGGRDKYGGHNDRKSGNYHFHEGPVAGEMIVPDCATMP